MTRFIHCRTPSRGLAIVLTVAALSPGTARAAGYYNLGAFWKTQTSGSACAAGSVPLATRIQNLTAGPSGLTSLSSAAFTETAGNTLVVAVYEEGTPRTFTVTDITSGANVWHALTAESNVRSEEGTVQLFYASNIVGGLNNVTVSIPVSETLWFSVTEYSGIAGLTPLDASGGVTNPSTTANMTGGTLAIPGTSPGDLIVALLADSNTTPPPTAGSSYARVVSGFDGDYGSFLYEENPSFVGTSATATATDSSADNEWSGVSAAFRATCTPYTSFVPASLVLSSGPLGGSAAGGISITVTGQGFDPNATVKVGGVNCPVNTRSGTNSITCTTGTATTAGVSNIVVTDVDSNSATLANAYVYGTMGTPQWTGGIAQGWGWQTFSATNAVSLANEGGSPMDTTFGQPAKLIYGVTGSTGSLFVVDSNSLAYNGYTGGRVFDFSTTGTYLGWIGSILQTPTGDPLGMGCTTAVPGTGTPGWCTGGTPMYGPYQTGNGQFQQPTGGTLDPTGTYLYIVDSLDNRVVKYNAATGAFLGYIGEVLTSNGDNCTLPNSIPTTWCTPGIGSGTTKTGTLGGAFSTPTDVAMDSSGTYLYVMDYGNARVEQFTAAGAYVGWLGVASTPPTACASSNPGCTLGLANSFTGGFVTGGVVASTGITGGFKSGAAGTTHNPGLTVDNINGYLYVSDMGNTRIERFQIPTGLNPGWLGEVNVVGTNCASPNVFSNGWCAGAATAKSNTGSVLGGLKTPAGLTTDGTNIYVADYGNNHVIKYTVAGTGPQWIGNIANAFTGGWSTSTSTSSAATTTVPASYGGGLNGPSSVAVDTTDGYLFVTDKTERVNRYTLSTGAYVSSLFNPVVAATGWMTSGQSAGGYGDATIFYNSSSNWGIALDPTHSAIYVSDTSGMRILKYTLAGAYVGWVGGAGAIAPTGSVGCAATGNGVGVPTWCTGSVIGGHLSVDGTFFDPVGLAVDPTGTYIYAADPGNSRIARINTSNGSYAGYIGYNALAGTGCSASVGVITPWCNGSTGYNITTDGNTPGDGVLGNPIGVAVDSSGYIYVADEGFARVVKYDSTGAFQGWIGFGTNTGGNAYCPGSTAAATAGWCKGGTSTITDSINVGGFHNPTWDVVDGNGVLWVLDAGGHVQKFNAASGAYIGVMTFVGSGDSQFGLGVDPAGTSVFSFEIQGGANEALTRYNAPLGTFIGYWGNLVTTVGQSPTYGQAGCPALSADTTPGMWCPTPSAAQWWGPSALLGFGSSQIAIDSATQFMYWVDAYNSRIMRVPINN